ncbi:Hypothetical protein A7982_08439 [Minicystis rosea]|nr:Hypothetical protein A7982_08439 [Minicystis rosea]
MDERARTAPAPRPSASPKTPPQEALTPTPPRSAPTPAPSRLACPAPSSVPS